MHIFLHIYKVLFILFSYKNLYFIGIYARGPQAHLIRGVVEQNYIFHVMDYALCLSESKKNICQAEGLIKKKFINNAVCIQYNMSLFVTALLISVNILI